MATRLDPFVDVLLRERAEQLYLLPDEPVTIVKDGKPRKVSRQPLTDQHIYALMVEVAPPEAADKIDHQSETEFEYAADKGLVRVRIVPEAGRLTAVISPVKRASQEMATVTAPAAAAEAATEEVTAVRPAVSGGGRGKSPAAAPPTPPPPKAPRASVIAAAPMVDAPVVAASAPGALPAEFAASEYQAAEQRLGKLLRALVQSSSSDLHLRVGEPPMFRTHGEIARQSGPALSVQDLELLILSIMPERNRGEWKETGDTDFAYEIAGVARYRVNAARDRKGPVEFVHENKKCLITLLQVHVHTESFKTALRAALREDPDIVLVGEMRDLETIAIAIETAETGHLVFGTLHTTTAASTVDRIIDQFPADRQSQIRVMLSESLKGVVSQTLCKKLGGGRVAAREILLTTPAISNLIREGKTFQIPSIIQTSKQLGMLTLNDALLDLVERKEVSPDEAYMKSVEKAGLAGSFKAKGHKLTITA